MSSPRQTFHYQRKLSLGSSLWSLWLYLPARWRGRVYRTALRVLAEQIPFSKAYRLPGCYLKLCPSADEALATEYVRTHTSIPVPQILDVVHLPEGLAPPSMSWVVLMTVLPGTPLFVNGSGHRLRDAKEEEDTMKRVGEILREWLAQLRRLESPFDERVCGFTGGSFRNFRISQDPVGPFASVAELHAHQSLSMPPAELALRLASSPTSEKPYQFHLTHGDLLLHNIMADADLRPTGLIDWECAAWMPEYWEALSSSRGAFRNMRIWKEVRRDAFPVYMEELAFDEEVQNYHGDNGE
ncbi:hypothetical protein C8F01DRAFT_1090419 [Mycena amicta]|nr:hypothetical protein C8F01DRAFT_1090419 [Mycena amicta]